MLNQIVWRHSEVIFLSHFQGAEAAGYFGLAYKIPQLLLEYIPLTVWPIVMAGISESYARKPENLPRAIDLYYRLLFILVVPVAAMGFAFAKPLVPVFFGDEMIRAAPFAQMFFIVFSYSFIYTPLSMALYVMEKSWVNMLLFTFLAIVNVGLDLAFIPRYGIWGAFIPVAFVFVLAIVIFRVTVKRFRPDIRIPAGFILRCYAATIPTLLVAFTTARWSSPLALALQIPVGVVLLILGFRWMKIIGAYESELMMKLPLPMKERIIALLGGIS
jgi:O-antigen/teichoic acid export membrane protein